MWSLKITTEQRYSTYKDILPDIKANILLYVRTILASNEYLLAIRAGHYQRIHSTLDWIIQHFNSFIIERTLDNQYQITFYE